MKKIFIAIALCVVCASCDNQINKNRSNTGSVYCDRCVEFGYNGHDYIMFYSAGFSTSGVVHNPDCHCFEENKKK